jgi:hypothetical protein
MKSNIAKHAETAVNAVVSAEDAFKKVKDVK